MMSHLIRLAMAAVLALAPLAGATKPDLLAIQSVRIIDAANGTLGPAQTIIISDDRIERITPASEPPPEGARVIDAAGLYAIPALIDSHVHTVDEDNYGPMFVAFGVGLIRDMGGATETTLAIRDKFNAGTSLGPRMIAAGAIVDGVPPVWPFSEPCATPQEGRNAVDKLADRGVDFIKVYSNLKPEVYAAIAQRAHERGLSFAGHVPQTVPVHETIAAGQRTIEHFTGFEELIFDRTMPEHAGTRDFATIGRAWDHYDELDQDELAASLKPFADAGVAVCPTLVVMEGIASLDDDDRDLTMLKYVPMSLRLFWDTPAYAQWGAVLEPRLPAMRRMVGAMHDAGIPILAGTDLSNPMTFVGWSLHRELELLVESGLTPAQALASATSTPARVLEIDDEFGSIATGKLAEIVLLSANPLDDITATRSIRGVVHRGTYLNRARLDRMLRRIEQRVSKEVAAAELETGFDLNRDVDLPGEPYASGTYRFRFGALDAGSEQFIITRDESGFHIASHVTPMPGGPQQPFAIVLHTDPDLAMTSAVYTPLAGDTTPSTYTIDADTARAVHGDQTQQLAIPDRATVSGPSAICDFPILQTLGLEIGQTLEHTAISFGFQSWHWVEASNTVTRLADQQIARPDGTTIHTRVFRQVIEISNLGTFTIKSAIDDRGVIVASTMTMPFGVVTTVLE